MATDGTTTITGIQDLANQIVDITEQEFAEINSDLLPVLRNNTPMGPTGRLKTKGWKVNNPVTTASSLTSGAENTLPYAARQDQEELRHIPRSARGNGYDNSFGTLYGRERAKWAVQRYGSDTKQRIYGRGYRRATDDKNKNYDIDKLEFIAKSLEAVNVVLSAVIYESGDAKYIVNAEKRVQIAIDKKL